jgi:hypothetical protein
MIRVNKQNGAKEYVCFKSFAALPEIAGYGWLQQIFDNPLFTVIADFSDVAATDAVHKIEEMDTTVDNLVQTKWFKKQASETDRLRIMHVKEQVGDLNQQLAMGSINMKQCVFYIMFRAPTKKILNEIVKAYKENLFTSNSK